MSDELAAACVRAGAFLRSAGHLDEAEALMARTFATWPDDAAVAEIAAWIAIDREDWPAAVARWGRVPAQPSSALGAWRQVLTTLETTGRMEPLDGLASRARKFFPDELPIACAWAIAPLHLNRLDDGLARFTEVAARWPDFVEARCYVAQTFRALHRIDEADRVVDEAARKFPDHPAVLAQLAKNLDYRGDYARSAVVWQGLVDRYPDDAGHRYDLGSARQRLALTAIDAGSAPDGPPAIAADDAQRLFLQFDSLGCDCEFGLAQRHFGAEPLGLFRWTATGDTSNLIRALRADLAGLGSAEQTGILLAGGEYYLHDTKYGLGSHTFVQGSEVPDEAKFLRNMRKRLVFLTGLFFERLRDNGKMFVYKTTQHDDGLLCDLHDELRRFGDATLLVVRQASPGAPAGPIRTIRPGLLLGTIGRFGRQSGDAPWAIDFSGWRQLCETAIAGRD